QGQSWELIEQDNPLNHAYDIQAADPQQTETIAKQIEKMNGVYKVKYGEEVVSQLFKFNNYPRAIGIALIIGLDLTAIFLISNTIKITIMARQTEIGIMTLVGSINGFICSLFFIL